MRKKLDRNVIIASAVAIAIALGVEYLIRKALPIDSPYLWLSWLAIPLAFITQRLVLKELTKS